MYYLKHEHNKGVSQLLVGYMSEKLVVETYQGQLNIVEYPCHRRQLENVHVVSIRERMGQDVVGGVVFFQYNQALKHPQNHFGNPSEG